MISTRTPNKKTVLLSPSGRCGTNWIAQMIEAHSKTQVKTEPLRQQLPYENPLNPLGAKIYQPTIKLNKVFKKQNFASHFWNNFTIWINNRNQTGVIKETNTYFKLKWLTSFLGPETNWVILNRDPRGIVASFKHRNIFRRWSYEETFNEIEKAIKKNAKLQQEYSKPLKLINRESWLDKLVFLYLLNFNEISKTFYNIPFLPVQYEQMVAFPKSEMAKILNYIGLDLDKHTKDFIQNTLTPAHKQTETDMNIRKFKATDDWKKILTKREEKRIISLVSHISSEMPHIKKFCAQKKYCLFYIQNKDCKNQKTKNITNNVIDYRKTELTQPDFKDSKKKVTKEIEQNLVHIISKGNEMKISSTLITNKQFAAFMNWLTIHKFKNVFQKHFVFLNTVLLANTGGRIFQKGQKFYTLKGFEEHPVNWITYIGANLFCKWIGYRLLSASEYNQISINPHKNPTGISNVNYYIGDTNEVTAFPKNELGIYDANGNVYSWTSSYSGNPNNSVQKIVKGGAWNKPMTPLNTNLAKPIFFTARSIGFRVASDQSTENNKLSEEEFQNYVNKFFKLFDNKNTNPFAVNIEMDKFFENKI